MSTKLSNSQTLYVVSYDDYRKNNGFDLLKSVRVENFLDPEQVRIALEHIQAYLINKLNIPLIVFYKASDHQYSCPPNLCLVEYAYYGQPVAVCLALDEDSDSEAISTYKNEVLKFATTQFNYSDYYKAATGIKLDKSILPPDSCDICMEHFSKCTFNTYDHGLTNN